MNIALIAHDEKKAELVNFAIAYEQIFAKHTLYATGTTGLRIMEETDLSITRLNSGPLGGDQQIGAMIATGQLDLVLFFRDPLTAQPHEPDVSALLRLCDVYGIPLATNLASAELLLRAIEKGYFSWRETAAKYQ
ncbi:methylglyoxal synthase [Sporosarcina sp. P26b]|uniref:methylglyoxal synthase n=1 Tax=Sporosarcina TaxID=1569 RepID=UPI000A17E95C|nr:MULTISPECIES: methylglyoxal synthase [Sporosarcina]ARK21032.1 methylglyoxal synthase [Sporosarcina ureae]PIC73269.1 methylglyoxal synthase [Sporosarcina sp. P17b]PIC94929.1 methylglyoxal synthase [Sporosarcina sp. P26b]